MTKPSLRVRVWCVWFRMTTLHNFWWKVVRLTTTTFGWRELMYRITIRRRVQQLRRQRMSADYDPDGGAYFLGDKR